MRAVGAWLAGRLAARDQWPGHGHRERRALAVDGKSVRDTRHASGDGQAAHLLAVADQQASAVLAQAAVDGKSNEITAFAPLPEPLDLTGAVITADAMHTQREHARFSPRGSWPPCVLTELRDVAAAQRAVRLGPGVAELTGMSYSAGRRGPDPGTGTTESGHPALNGSPAFSSLPLVDTSPDVRASVLACDDAGTLKFTLIVQRMRNLAITILRLAGHASIAAPCATTPDGRTAHYERT